jgi:hypothetical protein
MVWGWDGRGWVRACELGWGLIFTCVFVCFFFFIYSGGSDCTCIKNIHRSHIPPSAYTLVGTTFAASHRVVTGDDSLHTQRRPLLLEQLESHFPKVALERDTVVPDRRELLEFLWTGGVGGDPSFQVV